MGIPTFKSITVEEYLEMEVLSEEKHEYYQGEIFAMAGASDEHNKIVGNTFGELYVKLKGKSCRPYVADLRMAVKQNAFYTYPDISVVCGKLEKTDDKFDTATNPTVIIEVLSESTKDYDRGTKFKLYRDIPYLKDYIMIDATGQVGLEHFSLNADGLWVLQEYDTIEEFVQIPSLNVTLALSDIYAEVYG